MTVHAPNESVLKDIEKTALKELKETLESEKAGKSDDKKHFCYFFNFLYRRSMIHVNLTQLQMYWMNTRPKISLNAKVQEKI